MNRIILALALAFVTVFVAAPMWVAHFLSGDFMDKRRYKGGRWVR